MEAINMAQWIRTLVVTPHKLSSILEIVGGRRKLINLFSDLHTQATWHTKDPHTYLYK